MDEASPEQAPEGERDAQLAMGVRPNDDGVMCGFISVDGHAVLFDADQGDDISAEIRHIAVELRNGGRLE